MAQDSWQKSLYDQLFPYPKSILQQLCKTLLLNPRSNSSKPDLMVAIEGLIATHLLRGDQDSVDEIYKDIRAIVSGELPPPPAAKRSLSDFTETSFLKRRRVQKELEEKKRQKDEDEQKKKAMEAEEQRKDEKLKKLGLPLPPLTPEQRDIVLDMSDLVYVTIPSSWTSGDVLLT